ncbi:ACT domain-containing protein [Actinomycetaceae bacterium TAE3-ERU4]|nr:ACT domain-containing protein [Actinomycetaceae bacterium TAE3-ERU4]
MSEYLIVHNSIVPDYFLTVLEANQGLKTGRFKNVSEATRQLGISRSTYYKYHDKVFPSDTSDGQHRAVLSLNLEHRAGLLSDVLNIISCHGASVLTISQAIPIDGVASVLLSLDVSDISDSLEKLVQELRKKEGVCNPQLISVS